MYRRLFCFVTILSVVLVLCSCGGDKNKPKGSPVNKKVAELDNTPNKALLARLENTSSDSIVVTLIPGNAKTSYCTTEARQANMIKGSLAKGDTLSIYPEKKTKNLKICINVSEMRGRWFFDMSQHRGFVFEPHGAMSSINGDDISFREWRLLNGKLYVYYLDMQQVIEGRSQYLVEEAEIVSLAREKLEFNFLGRNYICQRQHGVIKFGE